MNTASRTIAGLSLLILGVGLIILAIFYEIWLLIYGLPNFIIGFFVLFNKKEDEIEKIKGSDNK